MFQKSIQSYPSNLQYTSISGAQHVPYGAAADQDTPGLAKQNVFEGLLSGFPALGEALFIPKPAPRYRPVQERDQEESTATQ